MKKSHSKKHTRVSTHRRSTAVANGHGNGFNHRNGKLDYVAGTRGLINMVALVLFLTLTSSTLRTQALAQQANEPQVKAAFLFNFLKFVEWPAAAFSDAGAPIIVGILGDDPSTTAIEQTMSGKTANGRPLVVRRFTNPKAMTYCHVLFIGYSQRNNLQKILAGVVGGVMTVGETGNFTQAGGIINFTLVDNKVRFEINQAAAEKAGLRVSAKLLSLSHTPKR